MLVFFLFVAWIWVLIGVIGDVLSRHDLNGLQKALWVLGIIIIPWLGVIIYLLVDGDGMATRNAQAAANAEAMRRDYIRKVAGHSVAEELSKLAELRDKGILTEGEFEAQKTKLLS